MWSPGIAGVASACCVLLFVQPAFAQTPRERAAADALFNEGRELLRKGRTSEACPKFEESQRIYPRGGTLMNVARCHEAQGKLATAWAEFAEALKIARKDGRDDRIKDVQKSIAKIEPRLSFLTVQVAATGRAPGLEVKADGEALGEASWGTAIPVDAGTHEVVATAPDKVTWTKSILLEGEGQKVTVTVPPLSDAPRPAPAPPPPPPSYTRRNVGFVIGGVGVASLTVGAVFGGLAISQLAESDEDCEAGECNQKGLDAYETGETDATIANITIGVGIVAVAVGTYLVVSGWDPTTEGAEDRSARAAPGVSAVLGTEGVGMAW